MTSIDAWVGDWEIGCCRSVPEPGQRWGAVLVFDGDVTTSGAERLERLPSGATRLAGRVQQRLSGPNGMAIVRCGPIYVFIHDAPEGDGFEGEGRLYEDNHFDYMDEAGFERWKVAGTVRRLWVVPGNGGDYQDWTDATGGLLQGEPKEVAAIDPRWVGPNNWRRGSKSRLMMTEDEAIAEAERAAEQAGYPLDAYGQVEVKSDDDGWRVFYR